MKWVCAGWNKIRGCIIRSSYISIRAAMLYGITTRHENGYGYL
jgi:hypothetical protein